MNFVFEVSGVDHGIYTRGDVVDVHEETRILTKPMKFGWRRIRRITELQTKMPRTNYIYVTSADPEITIVDARQFLERTFHESPDPEDPHAGGVKNERKWYFKSFPTTRANAQLSWAEAMADLTDKETGYSAAKTRMLRG